MFTIFTPAAKRLVSVAVSLAALCVSVAAPAGAWFEEGHEQIADIAWTKLTPKTKARVQAILLAGDRDYQPKGRDEIAVRAAFRKASTFADAIKRTTSYGYEAAIQVYNAKWQPNMDPFTTDNEATRCKTWHYFDTPLRTKPDSTPHVRESNALTALTFADAELTRLNQTPGKEKEQAFWLYWMSHIVGDLHQPLHCSESFEFSPKGDAGGNTFRLDLTRNNRPVNLHAFWDGGIDHAALVDAQAPDADTRTNRESVPYETTTATWTSTASLIPAARDVQNLDVKTWIADGAKMAEAAVYTGVTPNRVPATTYITRRDDLSRKQATLAGYRLAEMLNRALGK